MGTAAAIPREESTALRHGPPGESRVVAPRRVDMQIPGTPLSYGDTVRLSITLYESGLLGRNVKSPQAAFAIIVAGAEMGIPPMASLRSIALVEGKPTLAADLQLGRFKAAGGRSEFRELTESRAALWLRHPNGDEHTESFTIDEARTAGLLGRDNWKKYPKAMLRSRVITAGLKSVGFEPMAGVYDPDELQGSAGSSQADFPRAAKPIPAATADDQPDLQAPDLAADDPPAMTLDEALAMTLPGGAGAWGGHGGQPLHLCGNSLLAGVKAWCEKKVREAGASGEERPELARLIEACTLVVRSREQGVAAPGRKSGQVADALEPTEKATSESVAFTADDLPF